MPKSLPKYLDNAGVIGTPLSHKWNSDIGGSFYFGKDHNVKLYRAVDECQFKAKMALGVAITEWAVWRFQGYVDLTDASNRVEAAWANVIEPPYSKSLKIKLKPTSGFANPEVEGPFQLIVGLLGEIRAYYATGNIYLAEPIVKQAMLARHVLPNKQLFDNWLSESVRRIAEVFPRTGEYDKETEKYDSAHEIAVPREFFEPGFIYTTEAGRKLLHEFLNTLEFTKNPYLNSPEEMKTKGFQGTPYVL